MGKVLIIKGADFSAVAVDKVDFVIDITNTGIRLPGKTPGNIIEETPTFSRWETSSVWDAIIYDISKYAGETLRFINYNYKSSDNTYKRFTSVFATDYTKSDIKNPVKAVDFGFYKDGEPLHAIGVITEVKIPAGMKYFICNRMNTTVEHTNVDNLNDVPFIVKISKQSLT